MRGLGTFTHTATVSPCSGCLLLTHTLGTSGGDRSCEFTTKDTVDDEDASVRRVCASDECARREGRGDIIHDQTRLQAASEFIGTRT